MKNAHLRRHACLSVNGQALVIAEYTKVHLSAGSPTRRRGNESLLIRRDATLGLSPSLHLGIFDQPSSGLTFLNLKPGKT